MQDSFAQLAPIADDAAALFYRRLFQLDPMLKLMFLGDMAEQRKKLMQMLTAAVKGLDHLEQLAPVLQDLGRRHVHYGVADSHYAIVGQDARKGARARVHAGTAARVDDRLHTGGDDDAGGGAGSECPRLRESVR